MKNQHKNKASILFIVLSAIFITNTLIAEFIGVKIFSLEKTLGFQQVSINLFGNHNLSFQLTAGVLIWPIVFVFTDIINEYFGRKGVIRLSYLAIAMIAYAFFIVYIAIHLVPADFWPTSHLDFIGDESKKQILAKDVSNYNTAFGLVFGQGLKIIVASLTAFFISQVLDVLIFHKIKLITGEKRIWLRATGSTVISQFFDSYIVLFIAFYLGANWPISTVLAIGTVNYIYKVSMAILLTPLIYLLHAFIEKYLGSNLSKFIRDRAMKS
jgi:uncharacterized PurR-regulated membrane protein YhhQ (DUF165 family)